MAAPLKPALVTSMGKESILFVPAIADLTQPVLAELVAAAAHDLSCRVFAEQEFVTGTTEKVTLPRLLCEVQQYQSNGPTTYEGADLVLSFRPQDAAGEDGKLAWEAMAPGVAGFLVRRQGLAPDVDFAAGQFVDVVPVEVGARTPGKSSTGADGVFNFTAPIAVTGAPAWNVPILAAAA